MSLCWAKHSEENGSILVVTDESKRIAYVYGVMDGIIDKSNTRGVPKIDPMQVHQRTGSVVPPSEISRIEISLIACDIQLNTEAWRLGMIHIGHDLHSIGRDMSIP